ncbi:hypothetical protein CYMTET_23296 [Cymbomonas tetramitiformis]|uniref:Uncharacterized protein n=1 Tax=Cymbomonas tetramitiformis TaxID=36881 RepID=A0AAE0L131_9CHLO|nr:hypothetical protein CYMTET_23296 [Cymbomonas tetramitiformis]
MALEENDSFQTSSKTNSRFKTTVGVVLKVLDDDKQLRKVYLGLFINLLILAFNFSVIVLQSEFSRDRRMTSSVMLVTVPPENDVLFLEWLQDQIKNAWKDPVCGDGICHAPYEFASFGRDARCTPVVLSGLTAVSDFTMLSGLSPLWNVPRCIDAGTQR